MHNPHKQHSRSHDDYVRLINLKGKDSVTMVVTLAPFPTGLYHLCCQVRYVIRPGYPLPISLLTLQNREPRPDRLFHEQLLGTKFFNDWRSQAEDHLAPRQH